MPLSLSSPAFGHGTAIPRRHTCDGEDISPALAWAGAPRDTRSFALVMDDPDAPDPAKPQRTYVHWVLYDIPPSITGLGEGVASGALPKGTREGKNDWNRTMYGGPCPPIGRHRYFFKLYALDAELGDLHSPTKAALETAMQGHLLGKVELMGTYARES